MVGTWKSLRKWWFNDRGYKKFMEEKHEPYYGQRCYRKLVHTGEQFFGPQDPHVRPTRSIK